MKTGRMRESRPQLDLHSRGSSDGDPNVEGYILITTRTCWVCGETELETEAVIYPFEDDEGRIYHQIYINGELTETDHDAYTYPDEPKGAYYPIVEILEHLGVECLFDEHLVIYSKTELQNWMGLINVLFKSYVSGGLPKT